MVNTYHSKMLTFSCTVALSFISMGTSHAGSAITDKVIDKVVDKVIDKILDRIIDGVEGLVISKKKEDPATKILNEFRAFIEEERVRKELTECKQFEENHVNMEQIKAEPVAIIPTEIEQVITEPSREEQAEAERLTKREERLKRIKAKQELIKRLKDEKTKNEACRGGMPSEH